MPKPFSTLDLVKSRWAMAHAGVEMAQMGAYAVVPRALAAVGRRSTAVAVQAAVLSANALLTVGLPIALMAVGQYITFRWTQQRYFAAQDDLLAAVAGRPTLWTESAPRNFATNELTSGAYSLASQTVWTAEMLITTGCRIAACATQLVCTTWTPLFVGCLAGACLLGYLFSKRADGNLGETVELREARNEAQDSARSFWDNMVLSNQFNAKTWRARYQQRIDNMFRELWRSQRGSLIITSLEQLSFMVPMALQQTANFESDHFADRNRLLGKQISGVLALQNAGLAIAQSAMLKQSINVVRRRHEQARDNYVAFASPPQMRDRIHFDKMQLTTDDGNRSLDSLEAAFEALAEPGLLRLKGSNGAGKSSLLMATKEQFKGNCFDLPAKHDLDFAIEAGSSGEKVVAVFKKIEMLSERDELERVVLLDEWNANLDHDNEQKIREVIDRLKRKHALIEVIHH